MATIIRKRLDKAAKAKGLFAHITLEKGNPYWNICIALYGDVNLTTDSLITSFVGGRGRWLLRKYEAMDCLSSLLDEATRYLNKQKECNHVYENGICFECDAPKPNHREE